MQETKKHEMKKIKLRPNVIFTNLARTAGLPADGLRPDITNTRRHFPDTKGTVKNTKTVTATPEVLNTKVNAFTVHTSTQLEQDTKKKKHSLVIFEIPVSPRKCRCQYTSAANTLSYLVHLFYFPNLQK